MCKYKVTNRSNYPRVEYKGSCGFILIVIEGYKRDKYGQRTKELSDLENLW